MILSVIVLFMLMILLSTLSMNRHLICGNSYSGLLNLNLTYETQHAGPGIGLLISMLEKVSLFYMIGLITLMLLRENHLLRCWDCLSLLNLIGTLTLSLLPTLPWHVPWSFFYLKPLSTFVNLILLSYLGWSS